MTLSHINLRGSVNNVENIVATGTNATTNNTLYPALTFSYVAAEKCQSKCFDITTFYSTFERCTARSCSIGFSIHGIIETGNEKMGTSVLISQCGVNDAKQTGYDIQYMTYSSMQQCFADFAGYDKDATSVSGMTVGYAYYIKACYDFTMQSCGCEQCLNALKLQWSRNVNILSFSDWASINKEQLGHNDSKHIWIDGGCGMTFHHGLIESKKLTSAQPTKRNIYIFNAKALSFIYTEIREQGAPQASFINTYNIECAGSNTLRLDDGSMTVC